MIAEIAIILQPTNFQCRNSYKTFH